MTIMSMIQAFMRWVRRKPAPAIKAEPPKPKKRRPRREKGHYGTHFYLGDLLDRLDQTFKDMRVLKKSDRDAYNVFKRLGATTVSSDMLFATDLQPHHVKSLPAMACLHIHKEDDYDPDLIPMRFLYMFRETSKRSMRKRGLVEIAPGKIFRMGRTFDLDGKAMAGFFFVSVSQDGKVTPLRQEVKHYTLRRRGPTGHLQRECSGVTVGYPFVLQEVADRRFDGDVNAAAREFFAIVAGAASARDAGVTIRVRKRQESAAFAIDMERTPYFFADREKTVNENGQTKRIFHVVRGHMRTTAGGHKKFIKPHFRGIRRFIWNGYVVRISLTGKHAASLSSFDVAAERFEGDDVPQGYIGSDDMADMLDDVIA